MTARCAAPARSAPAPGHRTPPPRPAPAEALSRLGPRAESPRHGYWAIRRAALRRELLRTIAAAGHPAPAAARS